MILECGASVVITFRMVNGAVMAILLEPLQPLLGLG